MSNESLNNSPNNKSDKIDNSVVLEKDLYIFLCPNCDQYAQVHKNEIFCKIFRHAVYISNGKPIPPHSKKEECDQLLAENKIYGCGKPFKLVGNIKNGFIVEKCGYI